MEEITFVHKIQFATISLHPGVYYSRWEMSSMCKVNLLYTPISRDPDGKYYQCQRSFSCIPRTRGFYFQMGDIIDAKDNSVGAWFEAKIVKITRDEKLEEPKKDCSEEMDIDSKDEAPRDHDGYFYSVVFDG
jgi:hypothetical protein